MGPELKHLFDEAFVLNVVEGAVTLLAESAEDEKHVPCM